MIALTPNDLDWQERILQYSNPGLRCHEPALEANKLPLSVFFGSYRRDHSLMLVGFFSHKCVALNCSKRSHSDGTVARKMRPFLPRDCGLISGKEDGKSWIVVECLIKNWSYKTLIKRSNEKMELLFYFNCFRCQIFRDKKYQKHKEMAILVKGPQFKSNSTS